MCGQEEQKVQEGTGPEVTELNGALVLLENDSQASTLKTSGKDQSHHQGPGNAQRVSTHVKYVCLTYEQ